MRPNVKTCAVIHFQGPIYIGSYMSVLYLGRQVTTISVLMFTSRGFLKNTTNPLKKHIRRYLQQHDSQEHQLVPQIDRVLGDRYIPCKVPRQGAPNVHAIQLEHGKPQQEQQEH